MTTPTGPARDPRTGLDLRHASALVSLALACVVVAGCASPEATAGRGRPATRFIAVMAAYGPEIAANEAAFLGTNPPVSVTKINGVAFKHVRFEGRDLLLFPSGVSMVNAAMTTQLALDRFPISHVLFAGIAGGIDPARHIGDVVIADRWFHHSEAAYLNPKPDGSGYVKPDYLKPPYENFGFIFPDHVWTVRDGMEEPQRQPFFPADPSLLEAARRAAATVPPMTYAGREVHVSVGGNGISGPVFMDNREYRQWAFRVWKADCLDMESTAIAQVCWANRKPFLIVRSLSDLAGGQDGVNAADSTEGPVSRLAATVVREVVRQLR